jgi:zinc D-Ala-D-Ala dipeptidase
MLALCVQLAVAQLVDPTQLEPRFVLDITYATPNNFTGQTLYPVARCLLRPEVSDMLLRAQRWLDAHAQGHVLMLKDCYRPEHIQKRMWDVVKGTDKAAYVANPYKGTGSVHNYGAAVDLTLAKDGHEIDMGTPYDHLGLLAEPRHEARFLVEGKLTRAQVDNRVLLRRAMTLGGGFLSLKNEWWHFDALQGEALRKKYEKLDVPIE